MSITDDYTSFHAHVSSYNLKYRLEKALILSHKADARWSLSFKVTNETSSTEDHNDLKFFCLYNQNQPGIILVLVSKQHLKSTAMQDLQGQILP